MALPSRSKQIEQVAKFLDSDAMEGKTLDKVAAEIVDAYHKLLQSGIKKPVTSIHVGQTFKSPFTTKVHHVAWGDEERVWIITADSRHGWFGSRDDPFWSYTEESTAKAGAPGNNPTWKEGDRVSQRQREFWYDVVATGDKTVLLRDINSGVMQPESNENMERYYRRELSVETKELDW